MNPNSEFDYDIGIPESHDPKRNRRHPPAPPPMPKTAPKGAMNAFADEELRKREGGLRTSEVGNLADSILRMSPEWYRDLTPPLRLCIMLLYLQTGVPLIPSEYAKRVGVSSVAIYGQLKTLSLIQPVVRRSRGQWTLDKFIPRPKAVLE